MNISENDEEPFVSIVVPMRNEVSGIAACLAGFEAQTCPSTRFEVLVVDGRSDDGSRKRVKNVDQTVRGSREWVNASGTGERSQLVRISKTDDGWLMPID